MKPLISTRFPALALLALAVGAIAARGEDWPQWRGANRDGKVGDFKPPKSWPKELKQEWKVTVGDGVATPALVGDKLYVFTWKDGKEVVRCLESESGQEVWKDSYDAARASGPASGFAGARSSPVVADGKVVTFGVQGTISCLDAANGKVEWRKTNTGHPRFFTSSSPIVADGLCVVQIGGEGSGGIATYSMKDGEAKWKWTADGTAYASPVLTTLDGVKMLVAETDKDVVGLNLADGKLLWKIPFAVMGRGYNASTPLVDGSTVFFSGSGRGTRAIKVEKTNDGFAAKPLWDNKDNSVMYNTPVVHKNLLFGLTSADNLFCINAETGKTAWTSPVKGTKGYGSIVNAGAVLFSLTPAGQLIVYEPSDQEFKEVASYKVGSSTYAYPVISGRRIYIKDKDSVALYSLE